MRRISRPSVSRSTASSPPLAAARHAPAGARLSLTAHTGPSPYCRLPTRHISTDAPTQSLLPALFFAASPSLVHRLVSASRLLYTTSSAHTDTERSSPSVSSLTWVRCAEHVPAGERHIESQSHLLLDPHRCAPLPTDSRSRLTGRTRDHSRSRESGV